MKGINDPPLQAGIPLTLVQQVAVNQDQVAGPDLPGDILVVPLRAGPPLPAVLAPVGKPRPLVVDHLGADAARLPHQSLPDGRPALRPGQEAQAAVLQGRVLERVPEARGARGVRVQKGRVLVRRHGGPNLGLLADDHALEAPGVPVAQGAGDVGGAELAGVAERRAVVDEARKGPGVGVQAVADLVDGLGRRLGQGAGGVEGVLLKEEADLVARREEVLVADVVGRFARGEARERVVLEGEAGEEGVCLVEEGLDRRRREGVADDEVAVLLVGCELFRGQAGGRHGGGCTGLFGNQPGGPGEGGYFSTMIVAGYIPIPLEARQVRFK